MTFFPFRTPVGNFLYDRGEDAIIPISDDEYIEFSHVTNGTESESPIVARFNRQGLCLKSPVERVEHSASTNIKSLLETGVESMILQVTQSCNLRCDYCSYSALYRNRPFTNKKMCFAVARDAVDFAINHASGCEKLWL